MSGAQQDDQFGGHANLAEALAAFQAEMPTVPKNSRNNFGSYADLADVARVGHPVLAKHGLSFTSKPTLNADGLFVLAYTLRHTSGETDGGEFLLPSANTMQAIGGSVTYARRYALCAITGLVADEDTDAQDNAQVDTSAARQAQQQQRPNGQQRPPQQRQPEPSRDRPANPVEQARADLRALVADKKLDGQRVADRYQTQYGESLKEATNGDRVRAFTQLVREDPEFVLAPDPDQPAAQQRVEPPKQGGRQKPTEDTAKAARIVVDNRAKAMGVDETALYAAYRRHTGKQIVDETDPAPIRAFIADLDSGAVQVAAAAGAKT